MEKILLALHTLAIAHMKKTTSIVIGLIVNGIGCRKYSTRMLFLKSEKITT